MDGARAFGSLVQQASHRGLGEARPNIAGGIGGLGGIAPGEERPGFRAREQRRLGHANLFVARDFQPGLQLGRAQRELDAGGQRVGRHAVSVEAVAQLEIADGDDRGLAKHAVHRAGVAPQILERRLDAPHNGIPQPRDRGG